MPLDFSAADIKEKALLHRARDAANYIGPIDMDAIDQSYEGAFERFAYEAGELVDFERFIARGEDLDTIIMTAHPTFLKSNEEAGLLAKLFTAHAAGRTEEVTELEANVRDIQASHPYKDPSTDDEGERLYAALKNTVIPGQMMQRAKIRVAQRLYPDQWKQGHYSPFNRAIWQKFDRDGRDIPVNVQLGETIRQRRLGLEWVYLPQLEALRANERLSGFHDQLDSIIEQAQLTARTYSREEEKLAGIDEQNPDMSHLQAIVDDLELTKGGRITHPGEITSVLEPILEHPGISDEDFTAVKIIIDDLVSNGLCFATPTHRTNAADAQSYLSVERQKAGKGDVHGKDVLEADESHFEETEDMIAKATDLVSGSFTDMLQKTPKDGRPIHEMMLIRRLVHDVIDSHTIEKIDIAEAHNAMTQRALRLAALQYGVSEITDIGLLHEDAHGIDPAYEIYSKLLKSDRYLKEIEAHDSNTTKRRPRIVMKIGYSDFAKQHSSPGGKPSNEKCLLQTMKAIREAGLAGKVDLDIEFAGGEGAGRRVNPKGYEWTLKETVTPAVLAFAHQNHIRLKYRETIQGGDGCVLLGTQESAAKVMATQLTHLSTYLTADPDTVWDQSYYNGMKGKISEHHRSARQAYHELYNDPDFAMMVKMFGAFCEKGGSRKVSRAELRSPYDKAVEAQPPLADVRAIGYNARLIQMMAHLTPIYGQGTAFYENRERTDQIVQSELFRERLMTAVMVRDLQMLDELESFIEIFNPASWQQAPQFDAQGNQTTEAMIAKRLDNIIYSDGETRRVYPRLKRAFRIIKEDLEKFDQIIKKPEFDDVRAKIREGAEDYDQRVTDKRAIIHELQDMRIDAMRDMLLELEGSDVYGQSYSRSERHSAIAAGMCMDFKGASVLLNGTSPVKRLKDVSSALPDLCYNS